jgi:membrane protease YdiL (CAAX protease family)
MAVVVISATLFAVHHVDPAVMPAIFLDGVALAILFEWRRTLGAPILAHATILGCFLIQGLLP